MSAVSFTVAERAYLSEHGFDIVTEDGHASDGYSLITKKATNRFIRVLRVDTYEGGYFDHDHPDEYSSLDFL